MRNDLAKRPGMARNIFSKLLIVGLAVFIVLPAWNLAAEPHWLPFDQNTAVLLLEKVVATRLIPYEVKSEGMTLRVTRLNSLQMDWAQAQFTLDCEFTVDYQKSILNLHQGGQVALTGAGLLAPAEQKLGVRLLQIKELRLEGTPALVGEAARRVLDKGLSGKEYWYGGVAPETSQILTQDNFYQLLQVAINRILPVSGAEEGSTFTLNRLDELVPGHDPGQFEARFDLHGTYKKIVSFAFDGQAAVGVHAWVDPLEMVTLIRIDEVNELHMDHTPGIVSGIVRNLINGKLKGKDIHYTWQ